MQSGYVQLAHVKRVLGARITVQSLALGWHLVLLDGEIIGALYPGWTVSLVDLAGSRLSDAELAAIENLPLARR